MISPWRLGSLLSNTIIYGNGTVSVIRRAPATYLQTGSRVRARHPLQKRRIEPRARLWIPATSFSLVSDAGAAKCRTVTMVGTYEAQLGLPKPRLQITYHIPYSSKEGILCRCYSTLSSYSILLCSRQSRFKLPSIHLIAVSAARRAQQITQSFAHLHRQCGLLVTGTLPSSEQGSGAQILRLNSPIPSVALLAGHPNWAYCAVQMRHSSGKGLYSTYCSYSMCIILCSHSINFHAEGYGRKVA